MNENESYAAMQTFPWNILEWWKGGWVFSGAFESGEDARFVFKRINTRQLLRYKTTVIERQEFCNQESARSAQKEKEDGKSTLCGR